MVAVVLHAQLVRGAVHQQPFVGGAFQAGDALAHFIVQNFRAAAGNGIKPGIHQAHNGVTHRQARDFRNVQNFRRGKAVQVNLRIALLDVAQQVFVIIDLEVGVQTALHQHAGAAQGNHLLDFLVHGVERLNIALRQSPPGR